MRAPRLALAGLGPLVAAGGAFALFGRRVSREEAGRIKATEAGRAALSPGNGAFAIDEGVVALR